jgi:hypothetical protein
MGDPAPLRRRLDPRPDVRRVCRLLDLRHVHALARRGRGVFLRFWVGVPLDVGACLARSLHR